MRIPTAVLCTVLLLLVALPQSGFTAPPIPVLRLSSDFGIPADPQTDVSDLVTQAIATLPAGAVLQLQGMYRIDHTVRIAGKSGLRIECPPTVSPTGCGFTRSQQLLRPAGWPRVPWFAYLDIRNSTDVTLQNFGIRGPLATPTYDPTREKAHGVEIEQGAKNIVLRGLQISGVHGDFIRVGGGAGGSLTTVATNVTVEDVVGTTAGRQGIAIVAGANLVFRRVTLRRMGRSGIDIEPLWMMPDGIVDGVLVEDSQVRDYWNFGFGAHPDVAVYNVTARRTVFTGGLGLGKFNAQAARPHRNIVMEDVTYDYRSEIVRTGNHGSWSMGNVAGAQILRANWRFDSEDSATVGGQGEVRDSVFVNDRGVYPAMCIKPGILDINNQGTAACP